MPARKCIWLRRSLNLNHHLVEFFTTLCRGGENGQPSAQRAKGTLILATIKSTRLVANANRPEGTSAFPVSPYHTTQTLNFELYQTSHCIFIQPVDHLVNWQDNLARLSSGFTCCTLISRFQKKKSIWLSTY